MGPPGTCRPRGHRRRCQARAEIRAPRAVDRGGCAAQAARAEWAPEEESPREKQIAMQKPQNETVTDATWRRLSGPEVDQDTTRNTGIRQRRVPGAHRPSSPFPAPCGTTKLCRFSPFPGANPRSPPPKPLPRSPQPSGGCLKGRFSPIPFPNPRLID